MLVCCFALAQGLYYQIVGAGNHWDELYNLGNGKFQQETKKLVII
jgi:hypothetical protein